MRPVIRASSTSLMAGSLAFLCLQIWIDREILNSTWPQKVFPTLQKAGPMVADHLCTSALDSDGDADRDNLAVAATVGVC